VSSSNNDSTPKSKFPKEKNINDNNICENNIHIQQKYHKSNTYSKPTLVIDSVEDINIKEGENNCVNKMHSNSNRVTTKSKKVILQTLQKKFNSFQNNNLTSENKKIIHRPSIQLNININVNNSPSHNNTPQFDKDKFEFANVKNLVDNIFRMQMENGIRNNNDIKDNNEINDYDKNDEILEISSTNRITLKKSVENIESNNIYIKTFKKVKTLSFKNQNLLLSLPKEK
jgi:hypothetical protein